MAELWYRITEIPDLTLNKYASLDGNGVDGVLEKHIAFLRQLNRKGIISSLSFHLFYLFLVPEDKSKDKPGHRLNIYLMIKGNEEALENVPALIEASPLSDFYKLKCGDNGNALKYSIENDLKEQGVKIPEFDTAAFLTKTESFLQPSSGDDDDYYILREWEMNEDGRLYNMCNMMSALEQTVLYRVDLYPVEKSVGLRDALRKPMSVLRRRQDERSIGAKRDYEGRDVLDSYEELIKKYDSSPHFAANILVLANGRENATAVLDAAGAEALIKGKYNIGTFYSKFHPMSFLRGESILLENMREKMVVKRGRQGLIVCRSDTADINLNYLPTLFSLEEIAPFFRLPALYDGEVIQIAKETAPKSVDKDGALFLGKDTNGYDVYFPLNLLPKHAFVSGVPGSGKTNTMHHITSSLWKDHGIPFLVLEPAKQEYRALANDPEMKDMYVFSPNADMSFPLHINPFEMPKGTMVAEHIRRLCSVFEGAFPLDNPMPFLLDNAIEAVYRELGWIPEHVYLGTETLEDGNIRPLPTMSMLYRKLEEELKSTRYSEEVRGNLESALKVRIGSLLRREMGDVFDVPYSTFEPEKWLEVPAVIELESMGTGPANFLTLMLCSLIRETLKANPRFDGDVRHVIFIEEAHNLIGPESEEQTGADADPKQAATAFVVKMLAEVRALKEGIVIADQLPTVMAQEVLKNTGLKIGLRITSADDRSLLGSTMAASGMQLEAMSTFAVGEALIFYEKLMRPFTMRIKEWCGEIADRGMKEAIVTPKNDIDLRIALRNSRTYLDENTRSVNIIGEKYYFMHKDFYREIKPCLNFLDTTIKINKTLREMDDFFNRIERGEITASEEEKQEKYSTYEYLVVKKEEQLSSEAKIKRCVDCFLKLKSWIDSIERLKNGRWTRFKLDEEIYRNILALQSSICESANMIYGMMVKALAGISQVEALAKDSDELSMLSEELNEDLRILVEK